MNTNQMVINEIAALNYDQQSLYFLIYGFLAWIVQAVYWAAKEKRFVNHGLLTLPIDYEIGLVYFLIVPVLPTMGQHHLLMYVYTLATIIIVEAMIGFIASRLTKNVLWLQHAQDGTWKRFVKTLVSAFAVLVCYLVIHPIIMNLADAISPTLLRVFNILMDLALIIDFVTVIFAMRKGQDMYEETRRSSFAHKMSRYISDFVWKRLEKAYPEVRSKQAKEEVVFAKGASLDKLIWVFISCAFLGDIIETCYCRFVSGTWMSRSSVIVGPFSLVWGLGAVILTIVLLPLSKKNDRWIFLGGAVLGGTFEYMCSVVTEILFGTVFWDYSYMGPLSIGGRTNIPFMMFWGILGVIWIKILYPPLCRLIEGMPVVPMKIATWLLVILMTFDGMFAMEVLLRYQARKENIEPSNRLEFWVDEVYDDDFVKNHWPNMIEVKGKET